jgi:RES domain-containing protein
MRAYRIAKRRHVLSAFSGEGAWAYGGRWNNPGTPIVYAAQSRALAALEALAHFGGAERRIALVIFEIDIPDEIILVLDVSTLPPDWRSPEPRATTQDIGSDWQSSARSAALLVPSVLIPQEHGVLLNPEHPDTSHVMVGYPQAFEFDNRL